MNEDSNPGRFPIRHVKRRRPDRAQSDLNPADPLHQKTGTPSDARVAEEWTAFHLRKRGLDPGAVNAEQLEQVPVVPDGEPLQRGRRLRRPEEPAARRVHRARRHDDTTR